MKKVFEVLRIVFVISIVVISAALAGIKLMKIQIVDGDKYLLMSKKSTTAEKTVFAVRGEIVDSKGVPLVQNKVSYDVVLEYSFFPKDYEEQNRVIIELARLLRNDGLMWIDDTPISRTKPYEYLPDAKKSDIGRIISKLRLNSYATAENCIDWLIKSFKINDEYTDEEKRIIAGIRYQMILADFSAKTDYVFIKNVPISTASKIHERSRELTGVAVTEGAVRVYSSGNVFPHGIGYVGPIYAEEYSASRIKATLSATP